MNNEPEGGGASAAVDDNQPVGGDKEAAANTPPVAQSNPPAIAAASSSSSSANVDPGKGQVMPPAASAAPQRDAFSRMYHGLFDIMGGKTDKHYSVDPDSGKTVVTETPRSPGQKWAHIVTAALAGVAADAGRKGQHGVGGALTALGTGFEGGQKLEANREDTQRAHAETEFKNQKTADEATLRKAQNAREQQESLLKAQEYSNRFKQFNYEFDRMQTHDQQELADRWNNRSMAGVQPLNIEGKPVPEFSTLAEANDFAMQHRKEVIGGYTTRVDIDPSTHKFVIGQVPQEKQMFKVQVPDGKGGSTEGTIYGTPTDFLSYQNKQAELKRDNAQISEANMRIASMGIDLKNKKQADAAGVSWRKSLQATGNDPEKAVGYMKQKYPQDMSFLQEQELSQIAEKGGIPIFSEGFGTNEDPFGEKLPMKSHKDYTKQMADFTSKTVNPAMAIEKSYQMSDGAYREYMTARAQGKELSTGAASMVMLSNHLNTTFGQVKGARITKDMIHEHLGARSISDEALVAIQRLSNGDALSPDQWKSYHDLISQSRNETWKLVSDQALNEGLPRNFMPRGNGKYIEDDPSTLKLFFEIAGGSPQKAAIAAHHFGWKTDDDGSHRAGKDKPQGQKPPLVLNKPVVTPKTDGGE